MITLARVVAERALEQHDSPCEGRCDGEGEGFEDRGGVNMMGISAISTESVMGVLSLL